MNITQWWQRRRFWHRFTHGKCTDCGIYRPLLGATLCRVCFVAMLEKEQHA